MVQPTDAFVFVQAVANNFTVSALEWAPTVLDTTESVSPGMYTVSSMMSYYTGTSEGPQSALERQQFHVQSGPGVQPFLGGDDSDLGME